MGNQQKTVDDFWEKGFRPPRDDDEYLGVVLWSAGLWNRRPVLEYYSDRGADINGEYVGHNALIAAAQSGHLNLVKWLIRKGAKPTSSSGRSALDEVRTSNREAVVKCLESLHARL
jgi:ankyrin repeat protein